MQQNPLNIANAFFSVPVHKDSQDWFAINSQQVSLSGQVRDRIRDVFIAM